MILLAVVTLTLAAGFVPLLLRDTARAEERARWRRVTRPLRRPFEGFAASLGAAMIPAMQKAVVAAADMQAAMKRVEVAMTSAGARLAEEAERYANREDR